MQKIKNLFYKGIFNNKTEKEIQKIARDITPSQLHACITEMLQDGDLQRVEFGLLRVPLLEGTIQGNKKGFAFFIPDNHGQDLFIREQNLCGALHGDIVLAKKIGGKKGDEGKIIKILKRNTTFLVGRFSYTKFGGKIFPDDACYSQDIIIPNRVDCLHAIEGEKVVVKVLNPSHNGKIIAKVIKKLGQAGELEVEINAIIEKNQLPQEFSNNMIAYATKVANQKISSEGRVDLRNQLCITIDGVDSRDYDDAITLERKDDHFILGVHIADVTHYVHRGDLLDNEAYARGTSVYFPNQVIPMLPKQLSNDICSLNEGKDRYTLSCIMHIDNFGKVKHYSIVNSIICSRHRMTYTQVTNMLNGDKDLQKQYADILPLCQNFAALTDILIAKRKKRGTVDLDIQESQILLENGEIQIATYERTFAHRMIEEAMILANETVAFFVEEKAYPFIYRIHEKPSVEKAKQFLSYLHSLGIVANFNVENVCSNDYAAILENLKDDSLYDVVNKILLRSMSKAAYAHQNIGHFGLASKCYTHFTSPIRRYPDLLVHRIVKHILNNEIDKIKTFHTFVEKASKQCSILERRAEECERAIDELYKVFYIQKHIGESFQGVISGVTDFAIFVVLENSIEGMIRVENLPTDNYQYLENNYTLKGTKHCYKIGDAIEVILMRCDITARKIEFVPKGFKVHNTERKINDKTRENKKVRVDKNTKKEYRNTRKGGRKFLKNFKKKKR